MEDFANRGHEAFHTDKKNTNKIKFKKKKAYKSTIISKICIYENTHGAEDTTHDGRAMGGK